MSQSCRVSHPDKVLLPSCPNGTAWDIPWKLDYAHPHAITFCILEEGDHRCLLIHHTRPHLYIYNALKACDPNHSTASWKECFAEYGVQKVCGRLTAGMIATFQKISRLSHGFPRYRVTSGRLWRKLKAPQGGHFHVMMFWDAAKADPAAAPSWIAEKMRLRGPVYLGAPGMEAAWHTLPHG
jgi:hypothetical protein